MSAVFTKLNSIETRIKDSVFGYIRSMESKLCLDIIPALISYITLNYYYHDEYFAQSGKHVQLSNNNMTVTKTPKYDGKDYSLNLVPMYVPNTTFGNIWIDSDIPQIGTWKLKLDVALDVGIFIISKDEKVNKYPCMYDKPYYREVVRGYWCPQISVTFNTMNKTIVWKRMNESNDVFAEHRGIQIGENIKYKLGVSLEQKGDTISLLDFDLNEL